MAVVRANARWRQIAEEKNRIIAAFTSDISSKHRATTKVVKSILLNGPYFLQGESYEHGEYYEVKAKSLGAGVYELSMELKE